MRLVVVLDRRGVKGDCPEAWGLPPEQCGLMHVVGIRARGRLMDRVMGPFRPQDALAGDRVAEAMSRISPHCRWTSGTWDELGLEWNDIENTTRSQRMLANLLVRLYFGSGDAR